MHRHPRGRLETFTAQLPAGGTRHRYRVSSGGGGGGQLAGLRLLAEESSQATALSIFSKSKISKKFPP